MTTTHILTMGTGIMENMDLRGTMMSMREQKIMAVELKITQMSTLRRATMATTATKIPRKEVQLPWMTRTRIPMLDNQQKIPMLDNQQRIPTPDNQPKTHIGDNQLKTHMQDNQPRIRMLGRKQQKTRIMRDKQLRILTMQQKILTMLQRILTPGVSRRSPMTLTQKKMMEVVRKKQLQEE